MALVRDVVDAPVAGRVNGRLEARAEFAEERATAASIGKEIGTSGLNVFEGYVQEAYISELYWPQAYKIYNDMRRRVPTLRALLNAIHMLARQPKWQFEAASDKGEDDEAKQFGDSVLDDMGPAFYQYVEDALSALVFGWSWQEVLYGRRDPLWRAPGRSQWQSKYDDQKVGLRGLAFRRQSSWLRWEIDDANGELLGMWQNDPPNQEILLPLMSKGGVKGMHFVPFRDSDNPEGWPLLESCYEAYYMLKNYSLILGVGMERSLVGWPIVKFEQRPQPGDNQLVAQMVGTLLAGSEKGYVTEPPGVTLRFETIGNPNGGTILDIMKYYNLQMLQTVLADFIWLGAGETGSWSLGSDKSLLFIMALNGVLDAFADTFNATVGKQLFRYNNFGTLKDYPRLTHSGVRKPIQLDQLAAFITAIEPLIPLTPEDRVSVRAATDGLLSVENAEASENLLEEKKLEQDLQGMFGQDQGIPSEQNGTLKPGEDQVDSGDNEDDSAELDSWLDEYYQLEESEREEVLNALGITGEEETGDESEVGYAGPVSGVAGEDSAGVV
jgi:hypothetical protein